MAKREQLKAALFFYFFIFVSLINIRKLLDILSTLCYTDYND